MSIVTQTAFRAGLLDASVPAPTGVTDGDGQPTSKRYNVYRNNVAVSLSEALATGFPAVAKLIGAENFAKAAGLYLRAEPPTSPVMMLYGETFPAFLAGLPPLAHIGYLADVARLELAMRHSYHAADAAPMDPARLQSVSEEQLMSAQFTLAPSLQLIQSPWPVLSVYRYTMEADQPKPQANAEDVAILRAEFDPVPHLLPQGGAAFLRSLDQNHSLATAIETAGDGFDLAGTLSLLLANGALTDMITTD